MSNPCVLAVVSLLASLQVFDRTTIPALTHKSRQLTGYLAHLLNTRILAANPDLFHIITPQEPRDRGCQLSLIFRQGVVTKVFRALTHMGVVCDKREPDCIRVAPVPLYNSFRDVWWFVELLREAIVEMV